MNDAPKADPRRAAVRARPAQLADLAAVARLNALFNGVPDDPDGLAHRFLRADAVETVLVAEVGEQVVGFAGLRVCPGLFYPEPHAELTELYVEPGWRRRGAGRALIEAAAGLAGARGASELWLLTGADNIAAQALYRSAGFTLKDVALVQRIEPRAR